MNRTSRSSLSFLRFRHLMLIEQLMQAGTLRRVAKNLSISQPAATAMLNDIESLLGLTLFKRSHQGVVPTEHALVLIPRLRTLLNEFEAFGSLVRRTANGSEDILRIGVVPQVFVGFLPQAIDAFRKSGGCAIQTTEGTARELLDRLLAGELDCVIGRLPHESIVKEGLLPELSFLNMYEENICIATGPDNPLAHGQPISFAALAAQDWVRQRPSSSVRRALVEAFLRKGIVLPAPVVETPTYIQNLAIVSTSNMVTAAPYKTARAYELAGRIRILEVDLDIPPMQIAYITRRGNESHAPTLHFRSALQQCLSTSLPASPR